MKKKLTKEEKKRLTIASIFAICVYILLFYFIVVKNGYKYADILVGQPHGASKYK